MKLWKKKDKNEIKNKEEMEKKNKSNEIVFYLYCILERKKTNKSKDIIFYLYGIRDESCI
jgi:hypothetical protein